MSNKPISEEGNEWAQELHKKTQHMQKKGGDHETSQTQGGRTTDGNAQSGRQREIIEVKNPRHEAKEGDTGEEHEAIMRRKENHELCSFL